jgi:hypothetical protein
LLTTTVTTPGGPRPFLFAIADGAGPTTVPGFPTVAVGGTIFLVGGTTDALGNDSFSFPTPSMSSAVGLLFYSQVLTVDQGFTAFVVSNRHINLVTQTP